MNRSRQALEDARHRDLTAVVSDAHVVVCTGSGGVGKTTTAAALGLAAARAGRRTIVVTIDPARRLAQSLGVSKLDNTPRAVSGVEGLDAMMLDMKHTFDEVIDRHAPSLARAQRIRSNRFYQQLTESLAGTQEYMAMEKLYDLHAAGHYDCIVVDTPPTRNALDFLDAPKRLTDFLEGRFLKMFLSPGVRAGKAFGRAATWGTSVFMRTASRITGQDVLAELAEFFQAFEGMYEGFKERAQAVYHLLASRGSAFVVVATPEEPALREARYFLHRLAQDGMPTAGVVLNRKTPALGPETGLPQGESARAAADRLRGGTPDQRAAAVLLDLHADHLEVARREQRTVSAALHGIDPRALVEVPLQAGEVTELEALDRVGRWLHQPEEVHAG